MSAKIVYRVYPDINTEILALADGDVDAIANALPPAQVKQLKSTRGIKVEEVPGLGYAHMTYNMKKPDLAKRRGATGARAGGRLQRHPQGGAAGSGRLHRHPARSCRC